jgi:hypothetical protein
LCMDIDCRRFFIGFNDVTAEFLASKNGGINIFKKNRF